MDTTDLAAAAVVVSVPVVVVVAVDDVAVDDVVVVPVAVVAELLAGCVSAATSGAPCPPGSWPQRGVGTLGTHTRTRTPSPRPQGSTAGRANDALSRREPIGFAVVVAVVVVLFHQDLPCP